jgi:starch synthase
MERARPVIAAEIGGLGELVQHGRTGLLVRPGDPAPLRDAIVELARDPARAAAMGAAGRERALAHFPQDRCTDRTELLYEAALNGRAQQSASPSVRR